MLGVSPARIGSAAAVLRRVVEGSVRRGADRALTDRNITVTDLGHHLGPQEPGEFAGDSGGNDGAHVLVGGELAEPLGQADLRGPRAGHRLGWRTLLALSDAGPHVRAVLVGPGCFTELASKVGIAGPGDRARRCVRPVEFSPGTRPVKLMKPLALGKRRQSKTSAARHSAPILVTPR
jgi:hypothetical protein